MLPSVKMSVVGMGRAVASAHPRDIDQFVVLQFRTLRYRSMRAPFRALAGMRRVVSVSLK